MLAALAREFNCLLVWKLDRFGRSLVDCLNHIRTLEENGVPFIAVTQGLDTDLQNPASRFLLHVLAPRQHVQLVGPFRNFPSSAGRSVFQKFPQNPDVWSSKRLRISSLRGFRCGKGAKAVIEGFW
jgi:Resolvase, N terminal domain